MSKKMSRRSFLKMTAAGAVGAAGMGVFAPLSAIAEEKQTAADESGIQWDLKADIVVLGALCRFDGYETRNTQDIRLCRRTLRDAAARGRSPEKTLAMWDRVLDGETRYIKGFKTTADFLLDTSFTYELGLISNLLGVVRRQFTLEGHNAELWDETARRFEHVAPLSLDLLPPDSMLREFYGGKV